MQNEIKKFFIVLILCASLGLIASDAEHEAPPADGAGRGPVSPLKDFENRYIRFYQPLPLSEANKPFGTLIMLAHMLLNPKTPTRSIAGEIDVTSKYDIELLVKQNRICGPAQAFCKRLIAEPQTDPITHRTAYNCVLSQSDIYNPATTELSTVPHAIINNTNLRITDGDVARPAKKPTLSLFLFYGGPQPGESCLETSNFFPPDVKPDVVKSVSIQATVSNGSTRVKYLSKFKDFSELTHKDDITEYFPSLAGAETSKIKAWRCLATNHVLSTNSGRIPPTETDLFSIWLTHKPSTTAE